MVYVICSVRKYKRIKCSGGQVAYFIRIYVDFNKKNKFCKKEVVVQVFVNRGFGVLDFIEELEGEDVDGEVDQGDDYFELSDFRQDIIIFNFLRVNSDRVVKRKIQ